MYQPGLWDALWGKLWPAGMSYLLLMVAALSLLLFHFRSDIRRALLNTLGFCSLGLFGFWLSVIDSALGMTAAAVMRKAAIIIAGVAIIRLWDMFVFRLVLRLVRLKPPHILEDIVVMLGYTAWGLVRLRYAGLDLSKIVTTSALITANRVFDAGHVGQYSGWGRAPSRCITQGRRLGAD